MCKRISSAAAVLALVLMCSATADAAWVTYHDRVKGKRVSAWDGARNSINGAIHNVLPWNWGRRDDK